MSRGARLVLAVVVSSAGCLDQLGPEVGPLQVGSNGSASGCDADSDPAVAISFERDIRVGLFARPDIHCVKCHTPGGDTPSGIMIGGLDLSSYTTLLRGGVHSATTIVVPGMPCESVLVEKIRGSPPFGARMPKDGPPYLASADIQIIADWIAEGAHDN